MDWHRVKSVIPFPDPRGADPETGLVAIGGDLLPERLLSAYAHGIFPWYNNHRNSYVGDVYIFSSN